MVTEPADQLSDNALFLLRRAEASVRAAADDLLAPTLLTLSQYFVLRLIRSTPGSSSADLARLYGVSPRAMTGLLSTLESVGLVERRDHPSHRRIKLVFLTNDGERRARTAERQIDRFERELAPRHGQEAVQTWLERCASTSRRGT